MKFNKPKKLKLVKENVQTIVTRRYETEGAVIAWTDGSCEPNPGAGGWGVTIEGGEEYSGGDPATTNNRMEMEAVLQAIEKTPHDKRLIIRTDSQLVVLCALGRWKRKANLDMWKTYADITRDREVQFEWWRGHCGTAGNERADELAGIGRLACLMANS